MFGVLKFIIGFFLFLSLASVQAQVSDTPTGSPAPTSPQASVPPPANQSAPGIPSVDPRPPLTNPGTQLEATEPLINYGDLKGGAPAHPKTENSSALTPPPPPPAPAESEPEENLQISAELLHKKMFAVLHTSLGKIKIRLFYAEAPRTVQNFIDLARGEKEFTEARSGTKVRRPFYNGLIFHRVIKDFLIQTGCPFGTGRGGPGFVIPDEISNSARHVKAGMVAMANTRGADGKVNKDSAGSQFFITLTQQKDLDDTSTIFGEVIEGMDVLNRIGNVKVGLTDRPIQRVYLRAVEIIE